MRVPRGGRLLPGCGASGVGRSPTPDHSSFRACSWGPLPTGCGCGGCGRGDPSPTPQRALLRACFARCGGDMRLPRGGASLLGVGRPESGALPPPTTRPFRRAAGAHYPLAVDAGAAGVGTHHQPHSTHYCVLAFHGVGRHEGTRGGRLLPGCGASGVGRSPTPHHSSFRACGRGSLPTGRGCGGCGRGDPSPTPQHALLRAGFARCGCGMRVPGGGASCLGVGRPGSGALPPPTTRPFRRAAGAHYPLAVGAGGAGVGTRHQPHSAHCCLLALRAVGAALGCPGGAPAAWVWGVRGGALSHPRPLVPLGVRPGLTAHWLWVRGLRGPGPITSPTARTLACWLCALWARHEGARGGTPLALVWGLRVRALSHPRPLVLSGVWPGPTTHWPWVPGLRAWGPVTNPTARAPASWLCALWGQH